MQDNYTRELLQELVALRLKIKTKIKQEKGKVPVVCSDEALMNICKFQPKKLEDFYSIAGVGKAFIQNYGEVFLEVVLAKQPEASKTVSLSDDITKTLKELEKRLVNINRRNRLLRLAKTSRRHSFDLYSSAKNDELKEFLFGKKRTLRICDLRYCTDKDAERAKYRRLTTLIREANISLREKGQFDLYIGYPFVIGMLSNADFPIRAPLALFPIKISKEPTYISLSIDTDKDILYNNTIVLAHNKFNNLLKSLPDNEIEDMDGEHFIEFVLKYYYNEKINIRYQEHGIIPFHEYMASEFPKFSHGELYLENCAVLGDFPVYASSLQRDFNSLIDKGTVNKLLVKLLDDFQEADLSDDAFYEERTENDNSVEIDETKITYINDLNNSQEKVLAAINESDELVVQGPPGTGKSQTITSIIVDSALKGKNVLMVSEKKAALDVIHSRLGEISSYSLLLDDTKNKSLFYNQLDRILNIHGEYIASSELENLSSSINESLSSLKTIADALYSANEFGVEMYKLFRDNMGYDFAEKEDFVKYQLLRDNIDSRMYELDYSALSGIYEMFANKKTVGTLLSYINIGKKNYFLRRIKENLTDFEVASLAYDWQQVRQSILDYKSKPFFVRLFSKGKYIQNVKHYLEKYFDKVDASFTKNMTETIEKSDCTIDLDKYNEFFDSKKLYSGLSTLEKKYFKMIRGLCNKLESDIYGANEAVYNHIIYTHIEKFRHDNKDSLSMVDNFDMVVREILQLMGNKKLQTKKLALSNMYTSLHDNMFMSKRFSEIKRQAQSRRKISVHKFVEKFRFELFKGVKIWLLTPEVVSEILPLECGIFDLVIFDEASQMFIEKGIPSIFRAKKVVISGDHKQLRPSNLGKGRIDYDDDTMINSETNAAIEEESLLDLARFKFDEVMLNYHYRSKYEELIAFSNYAFYKSKLYVTPNVDIPDEPPIGVIKVNDGMWQDRCNISEAREVVNQLKKFFAQRKHNETIGIITFNSNQRDMILDIIDEEARQDDEFRLMITEEINREENGEDIGLFIKNIENVQGDERDVIVFSIGYAKNEQGRVVRNFGWLNQRAGENRLNVAISRAKKKILIVTSIHPTELRVDDLRNDGPKLLKKYLEFCFAISSGNKLEAEQILSSLYDAEESIASIGDDEAFAQIIKESLQSKGYTVKEQVGIGGYKIDLAVVNDETGEFILGIECDGKLYGMSKTTRERDIHRQKYLESRGWNIYRVWSTNWWENPESEIEKIITYMNQLLDSKDK